MKAQIPFLPSIFSKRLPHWLCICSSVICFLLTSCGGIAEQQYAEAARRWQDQQIAHYRLVTDESIGDLACMQSVEVHDDQVVRIISNNCQQPSLWTVGWLLRRAQKAGQAFDGCARNVPGVGCVCRDAVEAQVEYDLVRGFPRTIAIRQTWAAAWQRPSYWYYIVRYLGMPNCTPPAPGLTWAVHVRELRPLP